MTSTRPYLLRAFYEWMVDNDTTPHLVVNANLPGVRVPRQFVKDGQIVLNTAPDAIRNLDLANDAVNFDATFAGVPMTVHVPIKGVMAIYAEENGQGMVFTEEEDEDEPPPKEPTPPTEIGSGKRKKGKPKLRVVK